MSYSIIFETKVVKLSDGRLLHLSLSGCNNDTEGRSRDEFHGRIFTVEEFIQYSENFKSESKPMKESDNFDLKIGSKYCTMYDYGEHLLRMMKRANTFTEFTQKRAFYGIVSDGCEVLFEGITLHFTAKEWEKEWHKYLYSGKKCRVKSIVHQIATEQEIIESIQNEESVRFFVGKMKK